jgi:hypothetical protein
MNLHKTKHAQSARFIICTGYPDAATLLMDSMFVGIAARQLGSPNSTARRDVPQ